MLSTGNLQDIKVTSSRMTSLAINARRVEHPDTAIKVGGWLRFGHLESGWSYRSQYHRRANPINYPGPAYDFIMSAEDLHPRVCPHSSPADACVVSRVDMHAIHAKLSDAVISAALSKAATVEGGLLTPQGLLHHKSSQESEDAARAILDAAFGHQGLMHEEAALVAEALLRRADAARRAGVGSNFADLHQLNARALRFGQSRYSSGVRLLPDGPARTGKLAFNLSSPTAYPRYDAGAAPASSKRLVFAMEQMHQGSQPWSGARQYAGAQDGGDNVLHHIVRAADGVLLTTANLHDISAGAGSLTSLSVKEETSILETVTLAHPDTGQSQMQLVQPSALVCDGERMEPVAAADGQADQGKAMCFKEFLEPRSWQEAGEACRRWGGQLAVLERDEVKTFVNTRVRRTPCEFGTSWEQAATGCGANPSGDAWLALTSFDYPTLWVWTFVHTGRVGSASVSSHQRGVRGQHNSKQCAAMSPDAHLNAHLCADELAYVCQREELDRVAMSHLPDHEASPAKAVTHVGFSTPATNFSGLGEYGRVESRIQFPAVSGTIITTGNLKDVEFLALEHMNITEAVHLQGDVQLGSATGHPVRSASVAQAAHVAQTSQALDDARRGRMGGEVFRPAGPTANLYPFGGEAPTRHGRSSRLDSDWPATPIQMSGPGGYLAGDIVFASDEAREEALAHAHLDTSRSFAGAPLLSVPSWYEVTVGNEECLAFGAAQAPSTNTNTSVVGAAQLAPCFCTPWGLPMSRSQQAQSEPHSADTPAPADCQCGCVLKTMQSTTLFFEAALDANTLLFPDATGTIISTGNLEDIDNNVGLRGRDSFIVRHPRLSSEHLSAEERSKMLLQGERSDTPWHIVDFARHGSREDSSIGLISYPLPPGAAKAALPVGKQTPRGLWHLADLGPAGDFGDGDDLVYYLEHMHLEPRGGLGFRPTTGWTVPCTQESATSLTGICDARWWAPPDVHFTGWEEYDVRLPGAGKLAGLEPQPRLAGSAFYQEDAGCPGAHVATAFIANDTHRFSHEPHVARTWDKEHRTWLPRFAQCGFEVTGAGSPEVNGQYVYAGARDNVAQFRKRDSNIYLFRWGSMLQRISFPDATGVIITTGNPEDLIIKKMALRSLTLVGGEFGNGDSPALKSGTTVVTFDKYQTLMTGSMQLVNPCVTPEGENPCRPSTDVFTTFGIVSGATVGPARGRRPVRDDIYTDGSEDWVPDHCRTLDGTAEMLEECRYCTAGAECEDKNEIYIPDVSGTVITTGNMDELPSVAIPYASFSAGGRTTLDGDVTLGTPAPALPSHNQTFIHPDYLRFSNSDWASRRGFECSQFQSLDKRCLKEDGVCRHTAQVMIDSWMQTETCHTDMNAPGIKREVLMWYAPIDSNVGLTFSSSGQNEAPERGSVPWGDLSTAERDLYGNRVGSENSAWKQPRGARDKSDVSRVRLSPADLSGAGKALRHFLQDGAPGIRISVDPASSQHLRHGEAMLGHDLDLVSGPLQSASGAAVRDSYVAARVVMQLEPGAHLSVRVRTLARTQVVCTSDALWRDSRNNGCANYTANSSLVPLPVECHARINATESVFIQEDRLNAREHCCPCGGGTRVHPVSEEVAVVANVSASDGGPSTPQALVAWLNASAHDALQQSGAWLALSLQQPAAQIQGSSPLQGVPAVRLFAGRGAYAARHATPPAPTWDCTQSQGDQRWTNDTNLDEISLNATLLNNGTFFNRTSAGTLTSTCRTVKSLPWRLEATYQEQTFLYHLDAEAYERAKEVISVEILGSSALLPQLGFPAKDLLLFTAPEDLRDAAAPHTQPPLAALDANKEVGVGDEAESCQRYNTCALGRGLVGQPLATSTLMPMMPLGDLPAGQLDAATGPHVWPANWHGERQVSAMADTVAVTAERCRAEMRAADILNMHSLTLHALDRRLLRPTLLRVGLMAIPHQEGHAVAQAVDRRLDTGVWIPAGGVFVMELEEQVQLRVLRFVVCSAAAGGDDGETAASHPQDAQPSSPLLRARLQGSNESASAGFADVGPLLALDPSQHVPRGVYLTTRLPRDMPPVRWLRAVLPPSPHDAPGHGAVCLAEVELHSGDLAAHLSDVQAGAESFRVQSHLLYSPLYNSSAYMVRVPRFLSVAPPASLSLSL